MSQNDGKLIIVSGPSGAGKTSVLREVFRRMDGRLVSSVSATTRPARPGEREGVDYHFLSAEEFEARRQRGEFLECFEVFGRGYWYGTLESEVTPRLAAGQWVVLEIDVEGTREIKQRYPEAVTVFVQPNSMAHLEQRLRGRQTETEEALARRLEVAERELAFADLYQYKIINEDFEQAVEETCRILHRLGATHDSRTA